MKSTSSTQKTSSPRCLTRKPRHGKIAYVEWTRSTGRPIGCCYSIHTQTRRHPWRRGKAAEFLVVRSRLPSRTADLSEHIGQRRCPSKVPRYPGFKSQQNSVYRARDHQHDLKIDWRSIPHRVEERANWQRSASSLLPSIAINRARL